MFLELTIHSNIVIKNTDTIHINTIHYSYRGRFLHSFFLIYAHEGKTLKACVGHYI